jgi:NAD(P)-dependent dehydrogenase (short-subunit alcohol dehydrogenase family)
VATDGPSGGDPSARVAIVTGASGGIGRAVAVAFGALGWSVGVAARRVDAIAETAELVTAAGGHAVTFPLDLTEIASIDACHAKVRDELGVVDVLVNNAGVAVPGAAYDMRDDDHARIVATNLLGAILLTKRVVAPLVTARRTGDVVFMTSDATVQPRPHLATYMATKAGVEVFARALGLELEGTGIRSSVVRVGPTATGFADAWDPAVFEQLIPYWQKFGAQRHWGVMQPEEVAAAVVHSVTAPIGAHLREIEIVPVAPR